MAVNEVVVTAGKIKKWHKRGRIAKLTIFLLLLLLIILYLVLKVLFNDGSFIVSLKGNDSLESGLTIYESLNDPTPKRKLKAKSIEFMDNISIKWLPENINNEKDGSHNGKNYIAYTFYVENQGKKDIGYWYKIVIDDVIKNVDKAARIMIYFNDEKIVYAKENENNGMPEKDTTKFRNDEDGTIILQQRTNMHPNDVDKFTIVVWIEGDDPDCIDALIGGELRMHMDITEEHTKNSL